MKKKIISLLLCGVFIFGLTGCTKKIPLEEYEALQSQYTSLKSDHDTLKIDHSTLTTNHDNLVKEKSEQDTLLESLQVIEGKYDDLKTVTADFVALPEAKREIAIKAAKKTDELKTLEGKKKKLNNEIKELKKTIKNLNAEIVRTKGKARSYPAGHLTAGTDFATGRYKIYGGSSNFIVYSSRGSLEVNIILGNYGVSEYIYRFSDGDKVEAGSAFKMISVE